MGCKKEIGKGHKSVYPLWFSKSGKAEIEKAYAIHYVDSVQIMALMKGQNRIIKKYKLYEKFTIRKIVLIVKPLFLWYDKNNRNSFCVIGV